MMTGIAAGFASGLLGVGGAFIMVPALTALLALEQRRAQATALAVVVFGASAGVVPYLMQAAPPWAPVAALIGGGVLGATLGARIVDGVSEIALRKAFGATMIILAPLILILPTLNVRVGDALQLPLLGGVGFFAGGLSGFLGIGSGVLVVPAVMLITLLEQPVAQGVSLLAMIPTAGTASLIHSKNGAIDMTVLPWVAVGAVCSGPVGALAAVGLPPVVLLSLLITLLVATGLGMVGIGKRLRTVRSNG